MVTSEFGAYCIKISIDLCRYVGTMQICVGRMLQESTIFFLVGAPSRKLLSYWKRVSLLPVAFHPGCWICARIVRSRRCWWADGSFHGCKSHLCFESLDWTHFFLGCKWAHSGAFAVCWEKFYFSLSLTWWFADRQTLQGNKLGPLTFCFCIPLFYWIIRR